MIRLENDCCGCATPSYPCLGSSCSLRNNPHIYCDECGDEIYPDKYGWDTYREYHLCSKCDENYEEEECE